MRRTRRPAVPLVVLAVGAIGLVAPAARASRGVLSPAAPLSAGTAGDVTFQAASPDGNTVVFSTPESLVPADTDAFDDLYVTHGSGAPALLTTGTSAGQGLPEFRPGSVRVAPNGDVAFITANRLAGDGVDADNQNDVYLVRASVGGAIDVSDTPGVADLPIGVNDLLLSEDGSAIVFTSTESLTNDDTQSSVPDVYRYAIGAANPLALVTKGTSTGTASGVTPDGARVFWESSTEQFPVEGDGGANDLYTATAANGFATQASPTAGVGGNGISGPGLFAGVSPDGTTVVVRTPEKFAADDDAASVDLYALKSPGAPRRITTPVDATGEGAAPAPRVLRVCDDGTAVVVSAKHLVAGPDADTGTDVYAARPTSMTLLSKGAGGGGAGLTPVATSADCARAAWVTTDQDAAADQDATADLFVGDGATTTLASPTAAGGTDGPVLVPTTAPGVLGDRVFYATTGAMLPTDTDAQPDVYEFRLATGRTSQITPGGASTASGLILESTAPTGVVVSTRQPLAAGDADATRDLYRLTVDDTDPVTPTTPTTPPATTPGTGAGASPGGAATPNAPKPSTTTTPGLGLTASSKGVTVRVRRRVATITTRAKATCPPGGGRCTLAVTVKTGRRTFQKRTTTIAPGTSRTVSVVLSRSAYAKLRKAKRLRLSFSLTLKRTGSTPVTRTFRATVRAPKR